ncbi:MAG: hypothetical protein GY927_12565 [bacterium]|nr:hypothetical protein [bacterium]
MTRLRWYRVWLCVFVGLVFPGICWSDTSVPAGYRSIATAEGIPHTLLYAMALTESGKQIEPAGGYRPWPWTLNLAGQGYFFDSRSAAWKALTGWISEGKRSIDIGLMILVHALVTKKYVIKQDSMLRCRSGLLIDKVRRCV